MKIRFDHGTPAPQRNHPREHSVDRSAEKGWELLETGELIRKAEEEGYKAGRRKGQSTSPVRWDGFPLAAATLVVALPVQATEIDRGPPRDSHAMSRRSTGSGLVGAEEGTHKGRPYGIRRRGWTHSTHPGGDALLLGHILPVCSLRAPCPAGAAPVSVPRGTFTMDCRRSQSC